MSQSSLPRSLPVLALVAIVAVGGFWFAQKGHKPDPNRGGALFSVEAADIEGLLLTRGGIQYRFDRLPNGGWSLSGAVHDYLDRQAMDALVEMFPQAVGGPILAGTEFEDRRYEFNGPDAIRLRLFLADGKSLSLVMGALNPVTGNYFASGIEREGCFAVPAPFRDKLSLLPVTVQAKTLLPALDRDLVQNIELTRSGQVHRLAKRDGYWWLHLDDSLENSPFTRFGPVAQAYQNFYPDRRQVLDDGLWVLASKLTVEQMIYEVGETIVRDIISPRESAARIEQWDLDPPWRQVVMSGPGLNSDISAPVADQYTIGFGTPIGEDQVPAVRQGNALVTDLMALGVLNQGLELFVEQTALHVVARQADHLKFEREGVLLLESGRTGVADTDEGRGAWQTVYPAAGAPNLDEVGRRGLGQDVVVNLNRIEMLAALPPTQDAKVLTDDERVRLTLTWGKTGEADHRELVLEAGYLVAEDWPTGTFARTQDGGRPVGLWFPGSGKLLQIPNYLLVSARNMRQYIPAESR
ncbi:MAG: hypothetical protein ACI9UK_001216 [Candidatus Krumholzibacteriia bacterium]|jgi:hypothetical protein